MATVAVWMTNYSEAAHIEESMRSVLDQTYGDFILYVFDNHSPDESPAIAQRIANTDRRVVFRQPEERGLAGIEFMKWCWEQLNDGAHKYSITLGSHDLWDAHHLQVLVERMEAEIPNHAFDGRRVAIVYTDTWQIDEAGEIVSHYKDMTQFTQVSTSVVAQAMISVVNSPHLFGLWNEQIRREIPVRHPCSGWDHLIMAEAALHGAILFDGRTRLRMRTPKPGTCTLGHYGLRHLSAVRRSQGSRDFMEQLEWCVHMVDKALTAVPEPARPWYRATMTTSMFLTYMNLRGLNLQIVPGAMKEFNEKTQVQMMFSAADHISIVLRELLGSQIDTRDEHG